VAYVLDGCVRQWSAGMFNATVMFDGQALTWSRHHFHHFEVIKKRKLSLHPGQNLG
jgi:hypothetical protein